MESYLSGYICIQDTSLTGHVFSHKCHICALNNHSNENISIDRILSSVLYRCYICVVDNP